jgi:hypothetical protein
MCNSVLLHSGMPAGTYTISLGGDVNMERVFTVVNSMVTVTSAATVTESDTATAGASTHFPKALLIEASTTTTTVTDTTISVSLTTLPSKVGRTHTYTPFGLIILA